MVQFKVGRFDVEGYTYCYFVGSREGFVSVFDRDLLLEYGTWDSLEEALANVEPG